MSGIMYKNRPYAGGGAGGATALSDLTDTSISSPTNGQVLKYNNGVWENDDESGGTTVVANPTGTPTEELSTIQIGQDIYEIVGGGGGSGSGFEQTLLWDYVTDNNNSVLFGTFNVTLHDDINNYDMILVEIASSSGDLSSAVWNSTNQFIVSVDALNNSYNNNYFSYTSFNERSSRYYIKDTTFQKTVDNQGNTNGLVKVYGLKFSGGSGSGGSFETAVLWENTTGAGTGEKTLLDSIDNYDFISVWCGLYSEYTGSPYVVSNGLISVDELDSLYASNRHYVFSGFDNRATYMDFYGDKVNVTLVYNNQTLLKVVGIKYGNSGGGTGGASAVSDLTDVELNNLSNGQILQYNSTTQKWENADNQGGTDVEANPTGTPTDELNTIRIGQGIYEITGGDGGGIERDVLWTGTAHTVNDTFTLSDDITNYDFLMLYGRPTDLPSEYHIGILDVESLLTGISNNNAYFSYEYYDTQYTRGIFTDAHTFKVYQRNGNYDFTKIEGIKLGSGGGGSSEEYSTTEQTIGSWIDGKPIYKKSFEINVQLNGTGWNDTGCAVSDLKNIIDIEIVGIDRYASGAPANIGHSCAVRYYNNNVQVYLNLSWQVTLQTLTLKYTKTTD